MICYLDRSFAPRRSAWGGEHAPICFGYFCGPPDVEEDKTTNTEERKDDDE